VIYDAPYNRQATNPRLYHWRDWRHVLYPVLGKSTEMLEKDSVTGSSQESLMTSVIRDRATSDALLAGYQVPTMSMPPMGRPIGVLKLHREISCGSDDSTERAPSAAGKHTSQDRRSVEEVQRDMDLLQTDTEPLSPEAAATILSGSASLVNEDDTQPSAEGKHTSPTADEKRKVEAYRKGVEDSQRKMALDSDEQDSEGLQLFRGAYQFWNRHMVGKKNKQHGQIQS
jgi:hypothetical protein